MCSSDGPAGYMGMEGNVCCAFLTKIGEENTHNANKTTYRVGFQYCKIKNSLSARYKMVNVSLGDGRVFFFVLLWFSLNDNIFLLWAEKSNMRNFCIGWVVPRRVYFSTNIHSYPDMIIHAICMYVHVCCTHMHKVLTCMFAMFWSSGVHLPFLPGSSLPLVNSPILYTLRPLFWKDEPRVLQPQPSCEGFWKVPFPSSAWVASPWTLPLSSMATFWEASHALPTCSLPHMPSNSDV